MTKTRRFVTTLLLAFSMLAVMAIPAKRGVSKFVTLTDGSTVKVSLAGDEHLHFWVDSLGNRYVPDDAQGLYRLASDDDMAKSKARLRARTEATAQRRPKKLAANAAQGTFSKAKGQNNDYIQSINWDCEEIKTFKPRVKKIKFLSHQKEAPQEHENILLSKDEKIEVQILYRPNQKIKILFPKYLPDYVEGNYYSLSQCTEVLKSYLKDNSLFIVDQPGMAKLDATLEKILSVHYDKFQLEDRVYKMEDILEMWKRNLNEKSCIMRTNNEESEEIFTTNLQIRIVAKKMNNKNVTLISGLDKFIDINQATKSLAKHFATSVTIKDEIAGLKNTIFIQGYWVNELVSKLVEEFKINKKIIKVEDRLKSKVKKK